jgi:transcriptional antiterminator NusG
VNTVKWYVVQTQSGFENKAKLALMEEARRTGLEAAVGEVLIPTETVQEVKGGKKRTSSRKFFPGYLFVQLDFNERTWHLVKNTPYVKGFATGGRNPQPVPDGEIQRVREQVDLGAAKPTQVVSFEEGDTVRVVDGPFRGFNGTVDEVRPERQKVRVHVSIFGRATPVEFDWGQIEKAT